MTYPMFIKASSDFISNLNQCENGRFEDALEAREAGNQELIDANYYAVVFCDFGKRWKTQIEIRDNAELCELYYACVSGTIRQAGFVRTADRILSQIQDRVNTIDPDLVEYWRVV